MKKILYCIALLVAVSCSLNEKDDTTNYVNPDTFFKNRTQCVEALNGCYPMLRSIYNAQMNLALEGCCDLLFCNGSSPDGRLDVSPASPRRGQYVWQYGYQAIKNANLCVEKIASCDALEEKDKIELVGEAKVLRAYYYYLLTSFFGDVPYYTKAAKTVAELEALEKLPRTSAVEIRDAMIEDLWSILPEMEHKRTSETEGNRLRWAVGVMLSAKMAMWNERWEDASAYIDTLALAYGDFTAEKYPLSDIPFSQKNTPESIMEIQHTYSLAGLQYYSDLASICMPYPRTKETAKYAGVEVPELGNMATCNVPIRPTVYFLGLMPNNGKDLRYDMTMVWSWNGAKFNDTNTRPYLGPKFWCIDLQGSKDGNNYKLLRYADAVLMKAECLYNLGLYPESVDYLNKVKARAGLDSYTFISAPRLMEEIRDERARELVGEFQRKFDLVRWGIWYESTRTYNEQPYVLQNIHPYHEYYPIPDTQVVLSGGALNNDAYKQ